MAQPPDNQTYVTAVICVNFRLQEINFEWRCPVSTYKGELNDDCIKQISSILCRWSSWNPAVYEQVRVELVDVMEDTCFLKHVHSLYDKGAEVTLDRKADKSYRFMFWLIHWSLGMVCAFRNSRYYKAAILIVVRRLSNELEYIKKFNNAHKAGECFVNMCKTELETKQNFNDTWNKIDNTFVSSFRSTMLKQVF